jgi:anion-transporting  ArsA/GET3 family ATPase
LHAGGTAKRLSGPVGATPGGVGRTDAVSGPIRTTNVPAVPADPSPTVPLLDRRLIFVTGKGGVGKSTVALALGLVAARRGLRTIVAELAASRLQRAFDQDERRFEEVELTPDLFTIAIDPERAMEEYLRVKIGPVGQALGHSRLFQALAMATPGMRELLSVGKVWELAQLQRRTRAAAPYDLVVVDAPATGHGVGVLRTPRTFAEIAKVGPIAHQGGVIAATIADRSFTAIVAVSTPEEMPVNETLALSEALAADDLGLDAVILNARYPDRFAPADAGAIAGALAAATAPAQRAALRAATSEQARAATQGAQEARLREAFTIPLMTLPFVFAPAIGPDELEELAGALEDQLT